MQILRVEILETHNFSLKRLTRKVLINRSISKNNLLQFLSYRKGYSSREGFLHEMEHHMNLERQNRQMKSANTDSR